MSLRVLCGIAALWLATMGLSGLSLWADPVGDGFTRGLNRVTGFLGWQLVGAVLALPLWLGTRRMATGGVVRWAGRVPGLWAVALCVGLVGYIAVGLVLAR